MQKYIIGKITSLPLHFHNSLTASFVVLSHRAVQLSALDPLPSRKQIRHKFQGSDLNTLDKIN